MNRINRHLKKIMKLMISIVSAIAILFSQAVFIMGTVANTTGDETAKLIAKCDGTEGAIFHPGGITTSERTFSASNQAYNNNYIVSPLSEVDITGCNTITFQIYISDIEAYDQWKTHMSLMVFSNNKTKDFTWPMPLDLVLGWNDIKLDLETAIEKGLDITKITSICVKTHQDPIHYMNTEFNMNLGWMNSTKDLTIKLKDIYGRSMQKNTNGQFITNGAYTYWGTGCGNMNWANTIVNFTSVDLSAADYIEFDFYVSDLEALKAEPDGAGGKQFSDFMLRLSSNDASASNKYNSFSNLVTHSGWTHIKIPTTAFGGTGNWNSIKQSLFYLEKNAVTHSPSQNYSFGVINMRATADAPKPVGYKGTLLHEGSKLSWAPGQNANFINTIYTITQPADISDKDNIDFDFFINNWDALKNEPNFNSLMMRVCSSDDVGANFLIVNFASYIKSTGWNHISIPISSFMSSGTVNKSSIKKIMFYIENNQITTASQYYVFGYVNISAKKLNVKLRNIYNNQMLFQQNKPIVLAGTGVVGRNVTAKIFLNEIKVREGTATVGNDGKWTISLGGISGSYDKYDIAFYDGTQEEQRIINVVFGELWVASGQSNMELNMWETPEGNVMARNNTFNDEFIRVLTMPPTYSYTQPAEPMQELPGCEWIACDTNALSVSATAYWFADSLRKKLNMPVGFINAALGGTPIESWISRVAIDNNADIKSYLTSKGKYLPLENWSTSNQTSMSANFNMRISPLTALNIAGVIWYQGEGNIGDDKGTYTKALNLLIHDWSTRFQFENDSIPFVFAHIAPFNYAPLSLLPNLWEDMSSVLKSHLTTVAQVPIYDLPLDWNYSSWALYGVGGNPIHPYTKKPVGERLAKAAIGLLYEQNTEYTAPVFKTTNTDGKYMNVVFDNVGDGLATQSYNNGVYSVQSGKKALYGFTICGSDGVYVNANAQIISNNTVRVWNDSITNPVSVTYAFSTFNTSANLVSTKAGVPLFLASPMRTSVINNAVYYQPKDWTYCDLPQVYHVIDITPNLYDTWKAVGENQVTLSYNTDINVSGTASLKASYVSDAQKSFAIQPVLTKPDDMTVFGDQDMDYSVYKTLTFNVKNTATTAVKLTGLRIKNKAGAWYRAEINSTNLTQIPLNAGSGWVTVTANLNRLHNELDANVINSSSVLKGVREIELSFETAEANNSGDIYLDEFAFGTAMIGDNPVDAPEKEKIIQEQLVRTWPENKSSDWAKAGIDLRNEPVDLSNFQYLEFDYLVSDPDLYNYYSGGTVIRLSSTSSDRNWENIWDYDFGNQVRNTAAGETVHVRVPILRANQGGCDIKSVKWFVFYIDGVSVEQETHPEFTRTISNIKVINTFASLNEPVSANGTLITDGGYIIWSEGQNANWADLNITLSSPIDISNNDYIEFDYYVKDFNQLKSENNFSTVVMRLFTTDSQTDFVQADFMNQIQNSGWNHIKLPLSSFGGNGSASLSTVKSIKFFIADNQSTVCTKENIFGYKNVVASSLNNDVTPKNPDTALKPDQDAVYISSCESVTDAGWWTPTDLTLDTRTKTEGTASISNIFTNKSIRSNSFRILSTEKFDFKNASALKFDIYISDVQLLKSRTTMAIRLYSDTKGTSKYIEWKFSTDGLINGWNTVVCNKNDYVNIGNTDLSSICGFYLLCTEATFLDNESVRMNIDNIRIVGGEVSSGVPSPNTGVRNNLLILALLIVSATISVITFRKYRRVKNKRVF